MVHTRRVGHGRPGGVLGHARTVHAQGRRLPARLLGDRSRQLHEHEALSHAHIARQGQRPVSDDTRRKQGRSRPPAASVAGAGPGVGQHAQHTLHRDERQDAAHQCRPGLPSGRAHSPRAAVRRQGGGGDRKRPRQAHQEEQEEHDVRDRLAVERERDGLGRRRRRRRLQERRRQVEQVHIASLQEGQVLTHVTKHVPTQAPL